MGRRRSSPLVVLVPARPEPQTCEHSFPVLMSADTVGTAAVTWRVDERGEVRLFYDTRHNDE